MLTLVFALGTGTANADSFTTRYGSSTCTTQYDNDDGRSIEFYGEIDEYSDDVTLGFRFTMDFQKPSRDFGSNCERMGRLAEQQMMLDIQQRQLELQLLQQRVQQQQENGGELDSEW